MTLTAMDWFCGLGGTTSGFKEAGFDVRCAANHYDKAIESHSANHPDTEHILADIQTIDLRYLPPTDILGASPICTEVSPGGGKKRRTPQMALFEQYGHVPSEAFERTRVTFWEVIRATEVHRYKAVIVENVVEAAAWELFEVWLAGMKTLGYNVQFVSVSAAHIWDEDDDNDPAPQWRDRLYMIFTREGIRLPDVEPRPLAWCPVCDEDVRAVQVWKRPGRHIGKYGPQYRYACPVPHKDRIVEPYAAPAAVAIDWTNWGTRIGDRDRPLGAATRRRIQMGLETIGDPVLVGAGGNTWDRASGAKNAYLRAWPVASSPTPTQVTAIQNGIAMTLPFLAMLRRNGRATPVDQPAQTFSAGGFHHGLTIPPGAFISKHHGGLDYPRIEHMNKPVTDPMPAMVAKINNSLVIPYRKGARPHRADAAPLSTVATREAHGLLHPSVDLAYTSVEIDDCYFRMLTPREAANAQRFPRNYVIIGNQGEQQLQAGNANPVNVAHWLGRQVSAVLDSPGAVA